MLFNEEIRKEHPSVRYPTHFMIDCETLGVSQNPTLISIGCTFFGPTGVRVYRDEDNMDTKEVIEGIAILDTWSREIKLTDADLERASASTICWWMQQGDAARQLFARNEKGEDEVNALSSLLSFINKRATPKSLYWANGDDLLWLENRFAHYDTEAPWLYNQKRDFRTIYRSLPRVEIPDNAIAHDALEDAKWQSTYLIRQYDEKRILL